MNTEIKKDEITSYSSGWVDDVVNGQWHRVKTHLYPLFKPGEGLHLAGQSFFEPDNPARQVPARFRVAIIAPGQQGVVVLILNQQVHIDPAA